MERLEFEWNGWDSNGVVEIRMVGIRMEWLELYWNGWNSNGTVGIRMELLNF